MTSDNNPMDRLTDRARIKGESRMIPDGTKPADVTEAQANAVIRAIDKYKADSGHSNTRIARAIDYGASTISQVLHWKYKGEWQDVIVALDRWLEDRLKRDQAPKVTDFVWTAVAREINTVAEAAIALGGIGLAYGPETSGMGKTITAQAIHGDRPTSLLLTVDKVAATVGGLLSQICAQLRIAGATQYSAAYLFERAKEALKGTGKLIIVDQVHSLCGAKDDKPLHMLAELNDRTGCPQLWLGTRDIEAYLNRRQARGEETLTQVRRRISIRRDLLDRTRPGPGGKKGEPCYTPQEVQKIFARNKIRLAPSAVSYLTKLANLPDGGAIGAAKNVVVMATMVHEQQGVTLLTDDHLRAAHNLLVNRRAFTLLEAQMDQEQQAPVAKLA